MALMFNVEDKHIELEAWKEITPHESLLLRIIRRGTVGSLNKRNDFTIEAEFYLEDLAKKMNVMVNKIYVYLKSLEKKKLIIRKKTRSRGLEILGLNTDIFGQLLIDSQLKEDQERHLKLVVDNSKKAVDKLKQKLPKQDLPSPKLGPDSSYYRSEQVLNQDQIEHKSSTYTASIPIKNCSRLKSELAAHEERKREYIPKGTQKLPDILNQFKAMGGI